jgi:myo-inositol-1-phosphate synthase
MGVRRRDIGLWLIGVGGGVGSVVSLGLAALRRKLAPSSGLVTDLPEFERALLLDPTRIVVGGHEIRAQTLRQAVLSLGERSNLFGTDLISACTDDLRATNRNIRPGTLFGAGPTVCAMADRPGIPVDRTAAAAIERLSGDIRAFQRQRRLDHVVVVNLASSESRSANTPDFGDYVKLSKVLAKPGSRQIPVSVTYALSAMEAGCTYLNFTPSPALDFPAVRQRAEELGLAYMGNDGKTGETLVKSVLAPLFATRNLPVLSWFGQNILGNRDGATLRDPATRAAKVKSKDKTLRAILGKTPDTQVSIEYVRSLDDWKTAWDFIHFEGFLGIKMQMQFTWQGSDSVLAAPLVIDLARLSDLEQRSGNTGPMKHLAYFFKDPVGAREFDLSSQWRRLVEHVVQRPTGR